MLVGQRILLGLLLCLNAAGGEGGGGGGGSSGASGGASGGAGGTAGGAGGASGQPAAGSATPPATQQTPPAFDAAKAQAEVRAAALKDLGFENEDAYKAHLDEKKKAEDAKLSEAQRQKKLYDEAMDARGKAEAKAEEWKGKAKALEEQMALRDRLDAAGVKSAERKFVEVALHEAEAEAKKAGKTLDDKTFFEELRKQRPYFFGEGGGASYATTSPSNVTPAAAGTPGGSGGLAKDMSKASPQEWAAFKRSLHQ